jgi:hypothetical protein
LVKVVCEYLSLYLEGRAGFAEVMHPCEELDELARIFVGPTGNTAHKVFHGLGQVVVPEHTGNLCRVDHVA